MAVVVIALASVVYIYAMVVYPGFRRWGAMSAVGMGLAIGAYFLTREPAPQSGPVTIEHLVIDQLELARSARGATLSGRVENRSPNGRLREITLSMNLYDCPEGAENVQECPIVGESRAIARVDVPPGQFRGFSTHFLFANVPPIVGELRWSERIVAIRATD